MDHNENEVIKCIQAQNALAEQLSQQLQDAREEIERLEELLHNRAKCAAGLRAEINTGRRWARLWKRTAKWNRAQYKLTERIRRHTAHGLSSKDAEIKRLREAVENILGIAATSEGVTMDADIGQVYRVARTALEATE